MPQSLNAATVGPIDVAVIVFDGNEFNGDVNPSLTELQQSGTVRVLDLAFITKDAAGVWAIVEIEDADIAEAFELVTGEQFDLLNDEDLSSIAESLEPNTSALALVWENTWAARFAAAVRASQGSLVFFERIPRESVVLAIAALDEE